MMKAALTLGSGICRRLWSYSMRFLFLMSFVSGIIASYFTQSAPATAEDRAEKSNEIAPFYGFSGIELFKVEPRAFNLQAGDFNGDGLTDILLVDNRASCLRLRAQRSTADFSR